MQKIKTIILCLCGWFTLSALLAGDAPEENKVWSLQDCVAYALKHNLQVQKQRLAAEGAVVDRMEARGQFFPDLSAAASTSLTKTGAAETLNESSALTSSASLSSGLVVYKGGAQRNALKRSQLNYQWTLLSVEAAEQDIVVGVLEQFMNVLYARENLKYYQEVAGHSKKQVEEVQLLFEAGSKTRRDLLDVRAQLSSDEYVALSAAHLFNQQQTALKQLLELPVEASFEVDSLPDTLFQSGFLLPGRGEVFSSALAHRPEMKMQQLGLDMAEIDLKSARSNYLPQLSLSAGLSTHYGDHLQQAVSLQLKIPLFAGFASRANLQRRRLALEEQQLEMDNVRNQLLQKIERSYEDLEAAWARYRAAEIQEVAAGESYALAREQFALGMLTSIELLQVREVWLSAGKEQLQAKYTVLLQRQVLNHFTGGLLGES
ncbi:TolC family protein [Geofilum rhodophaeum]|uniref:TolC family protein n=1 Tax=Geofilum rhodophaeum TaxID=1965019 RepID=UPI000B524D44|nr:TolC family protein [Geofilum rhodophaeum]